MNAPRRRPSRSSVRCRTTDTQALQARAVAGAAASVLAMVLAACGARDIGWDDELYDDGTAGAGNTAGFGAGGSGAGGSGAGGSGAGGSGAGGSGAGGSGAGGSGAGGSGAGGSGGGGIVEDCTNGIDDDGDGFVDCADTECDEFLCAAPVPPGGWSGPLAVWVGSGSDDLPNCSSAGGYPDPVADGWAGLIAEDPTCPNCSCSAPQGVACQVAGGGLYGSDNCSGGGGVLTIPEGICQGFITSTIDPASVLWDSAPAAGGACIPQASGPPDIPPPEWISRARTCGDPEQGGGCGAGVCVPEPAGDFMSWLCIYRAGDVSCPAGPYSLQLTYYDGYSDTRDCTSCGCDDPTGTSCVGTLRLWTDTSCNDDEVTLHNVGDCESLPPDPTPPPPPYMSLRSMRYDGAPSGSGSCAVDPSSMTGDVMPVGPITVCCEP